ncbi:MAG: RNA polymerase sigma factor [Tepidisphaeraceae bacterium]
MTDEPQAETSSSDGALLGRYATANDELAFAELLRRHGPMVSATARRLHAPEADDIAQAAFLLLARKAGALASHPSVAGWLHETTRWCAANARRSAWRRERHEAAAREAGASRPSAGSVEADVLAVLDDALDRLPKKYRDVVLLRYLEGLSLQESADRLKIRSAAVATRASRGIDKLRHHFARRGLSMSADALCGCMAAQVGGAVGSGGSGGLAQVHGSHGFSAAARQLASSTGRSMTLAHAKAVLVAAALVAGVPAVIWGATQLWPGATPSLVAILPTPRPASGVSAPPAPAVDALPMPPIDAGLTADTARQTAMAFLTALRNADAETLASLMTPPDAAQTLARDYVGRYRQGEYARYPERLLQITDSVAQVDAQQHPLTASYRVQSPYNARAAQLTVRVAVVGDRWKVMSADFSANDAWAGAGNVIDLTDRTQAIDVPPAARQAWSQIEQINRRGPGALSAKEIPEVVAELDRTEAAIQTLADSLQATRLRLPADQVALARQAVREIRDRVQRDGDAGFKQATAAMRADSKKMQAFATLFQTSTAMERADDAQQERVHAKPRPVSVAGDLIFTGKDGQTYRAPGPLKVPAWLNDTHAYQRWLAQNSLCTMLTADDAGNVYRVQFNGGFTTLIQRYRPDKTLAEVTMLIEGAPVWWKAVDAAGRQYVWDVDQSRYASADTKGPRVLNRIVRYDAAGNETIWDDFTPEGAARMQGEAGPIGEPRGR